ncbi:MAG: acyl carrier protein [Clostridia bacterium]|nr:acyl carrier protein [Clostridia bacterium]
MVFEKVREILAQQLDIEEESINMESNIQEDLGADSLDLVDLLMTLEDDYGLEVPDEDVEKIKTVGDLVAYIEERQAD